MYGTKQLLPAAGLEGSWIEHGWSNSLSVLLLGFPIPPSTAVDACVWFVRADENDKSCRAPGTHTKPSREKERISILPSNKRQWSVRGYYCQNGSYADLACKLCGLRSCLTCFSRVSILENEPAYANYMLTLLYKNNKTNVLQNANYRHAIDFPLIK